MVKKKIPPLNLLLVESNPHDATLVADWLLQAATTFHIVWKQQASQAITSLKDKTESYQIILLNLSASQDNNTFDELFSLSPHTPLVVTVSLKNETLADQVIERGGQDVLVKEQITSRLLERSLQQAIKRHHIRTNLTTQQDNWEKVFQATGNPTIIMDKQHKIIAANRAATHINGIVVDLLQKHCYSIFHQSKKPPSGCPMERSLQSHCQEKEEVYVELLDKTFLVNCTPVFNETGAVDKIIHAATDITDRKLAENKLAKSEAKYRTLVENVNIGIYRSTIGRRGKMVEANPALIKMFGYDSLSELQFGAMSDHYHHPAERNQFILNILHTGVVRNKELEMVKKNGSRFWVSSTATLCYDETGEPQWIDGVLEDITKRKRAEDRLRHEAIHDSLTNLYNRRYFMQQLKKAVKAAKRYKYQLAISIADLDNFKYINDHYGHQFGDQVLIAFSRIVQEELRQEDIAGRQGGDEFCFLFPHISAQDALICNERIRSRFSQITFASDQPAPFTASVTLGIAQLSFEQETGKELLELADKALYYAKDQGRNCVEIYVPKEKNQRKD